MNKLDELNKKYNDDTYPVYPFIDKNRVVTLKAGLYRKHKASFRGVTALYNAETQQYEYPLYGMYNVEKDIVIVHPDITMTAGKQSYLDASLMAGYTQVEQAPKFKPVLFPEDSPEAEAALENRVLHNYNTLTR